MAGFSFIDTLTGIRENTPRLPGEGGNEYNQRTRAIAFKLRQEFVVNDRLRSTFKSLPRPRDDELPFYKPIPTPTTTNGSTTYTAPLELEQSTRVERWAMPVRDELAHPKQNKLKRNQEKYKR